MGACLLCRKEFSTILIFKNVFTKLNIMKKPNILALLPFIVKGALSIKILRAMRQKGFDVTLSFRQNIPHIYVPDPLDDFIAEDRLIDLSSLSQSQCINYLENEIDKRCVDLILQIGAFDLYHCLPYLKERKPDLKIIDTLYNEYGHSLNHFLYEECIDGVIVESESMRKFVEQASEKIKPNIKILSTGIDLDTFLPYQGCSGGAGIVVGYVGRISDEKNPLGFIDLAERLTESIFNVTFKMFGAGDQTEFVRERINQSPARSRLIFEGFVDSIIDALIQIDVLILPSKFDGRPNIIMEANACGIPVIAAPVGGVPEMIFEGINGYLLSPQDVYRIGELITDWIRFPESLKELKRTSRDTALARFDSKAMVNAYADAFTDFAAA